jgi:Actin
VFKGISSLRMRLLAMQLPDGTQIEIGPDRFAVPEVLFNPVGPSTQSNAASCQRADRVVVCRCTSLCTVTVHQASQPLLVLCSRCYQASGSRR